MATFRVTTSRNRLGRKRWHWSLVANNGEPIATSESYNSRAAALKGARVVAMLASAARIVEDDLHDA